MNTETGQVYYGEEAIRAATLRGEPIVEVSPQVAQFVKIGKEVVEKQARMTRGQARRKLRELGLHVPKK